MVHGAQNTNAGVAMPIASAAIALKALPKEEGAARKDGSPGKKML
jgi:hypothetical protein